MVFEGQVDALYVNNMLVNVMDSMAKETHSAWRPRSPQNNQPPDPDLVREVRYRDPILQRSILGPARASKRGMPSQEHLIARSTSLPAWRYGQRDHAMYGT